MSRSLTVPGRYDRLEQLCRFVAEAADEAGLDESASSHCQLAVDEACTNVIEHGYGGEDRGTIQLTCAVTPGELTITIQDQAQPFDPAGVPEPQLNAPLDELRIGGLGLYFMRQVMDAVEFSYVDGGNRLVLVKRRDGRPDAP
jgi:anti-sigma regulatory factor (Ser/Thr protein kinase)